MDVTKLLNKIFLTLFFFWCVTINANAATIGNRTFTFVNNCSQPVWFGLAGGSAQSKLTGTQCNTSNDCYTGSSCIQTGNISQCFWNNPQPASGNFQLAANGGTNQVSIPIDDGTLPIVWSGVIAGRTNCTGSGCQTADCSNGSGSCLMSRGFSPPATQAEFTLGKSGVDFYDVEIINGVNIPIQMSPSVTGSSTSPYTCGSPGAAQPSSSLLGACNWNFVPPSNDYRWVTNGGNACSQDADCQGSVCGLSFNPGKSPLLQKTCGSPLGYWTADQVCGIQNNYGAPFNCSQPLPAPQANLTLWNLYACVGVGSCYQNNAGKDCCGCVNWDSIGVPVPPAPYTQQCTNQNPTWLQSVNPTLTWLKKACPTAYTYPFDDMSSTFTCSQIQNQINTVNYTITYCPAVAPPVQQYAYTVYIGYPFLPVVINNQITCPDPVTKNPACLVQGQAAGSSMIIKGGQNHSCNLTIGADGGITVNSSQSNYCYINTTPATATAPGTIALNSGFLK